MIGIDLVQSTAETLMRKAAIEIPDDYLAGLKTAAAAEDGDLSSFVLEAMLENYAAAKKTAAPCAVILAVRAGMSKWAMRPALMVAR